jgi:polyisoprenoid-binding protein YceI
VTVIAGEYRLGPECGRLILKTARVGLAAKAGHDLTLEVTQWSAHVVVPSEDQGGLAAMTLSVEADLGSLTTREGTGGAKPLTRADHDEIDKTARRILAGRGNATATFKSSQVRALSDGGEIDGTITINDVAQPLRLRLTEQGPDRYQGTGTIVQSAHGIKPYSALLGTLKLQDEVKLEFEADLTKARPRTGVNFPGAAGGLGDTSRVGRWLRRPCAPSRTDPGDARTGSRSAPHAAASSPVPAHRSRSSTRQKRRGPGRPA